MLAISTDSLKGYGLNRMFQIAKEAGYDGLDLAIDPRNFDTLNTDYVKSLVDQSGFPVVAIQAPHTNNPKKIQNVVDMAKKIGTKIIVIQPPRFFDYKYISWMKNEIPKIRQKENISIALENAPSKSFFGIIPEHAMGNILDLKKFKHACLDTARLAQRREDLILVYKTLKKYLVHIHLSNVRTGTPYAPLEKGTLPLESFLTKLKQDEFPGAISLKVNGKFLHTGNDDKLMQSLAEEKKFFDTYFTNVKIMTGEEDEDSGDAAPETDSDSGDESNE